MRMSIQKQPNTLPHVVVVGAGFGGMYAAKRLAREARRGLLQLTVVNDINYFLFTPLLHEVATGALSPTSVIEPLREAVNGKNVRVLTARVRSVDAGRRVVMLEPSDKHQSTSPLPSPVQERGLPYDYLIIATGAKSNRVRISGAEAHTFSLKSLSDAVAIRNAVIERFEQAARISSLEERARTLSFAVIVGGPTGVELVAELAEFLRELEEKYCPIHTASGLSRFHLTPTLSCPGEGATRPTGCATITLVQSREELLPQYHPDLRRAAAARLRAIGVRTLFNEQVVSVTPSEVVLSSGANLSTSLTVMTTGVVPSPLPIDGAETEYLHGRLLVDSTLRVRGSDTIFAVGDAAALANAEGHSHPMLAQVAVPQGIAAANNIIATISGRPLRSFHYRMRGELVSIGQWYAVADLQRVRFTGRFAWYLWRTIYLFKFASSRKRWRIAFEWTINLFYSRDTASIR